MNGSHRMESLILPTDEFTRWDSLKDENLPSPTHETDRPSAAELARFHRFIRPRMTHTEIRMGSDDLQSESI